MKSAIHEAVLSWASFKQSKDLKKNDGAKRSRLTGIPKLDDANDAGTKNSQDCTLILTEGDSAKGCGTPELPGLHPHPIRGQLCQGTPGRPPPARYSVADSALQ
eukprot:7839063-Pyramimonas_sp.AAC.1